jgi:hypothetical protein
VRAAPTTVSNSLFASERVCSKTARYFIVPSAVVSEYVRAEHRLWLDTTKKGKDGPMRLFRIGFDEEKYRIPTATAKQYEDNWEFNR